MSWKSISNKNIREREPNKWKRCEEGALALVPREPIISQKLGARALVLLEKLVQRYQPGQLVPFKDLGSTMAIKSALNILWRAGYLDKYALGEWGGGWRGKHARTAGRYWGVHYSLTEKVYEISRRNS